MNTTDMAQATAESLVTAVRLLDHAARVALRPDNEGDGWAHYSFGQGIYLAWAQACAMLPADHGAVETVPPTDMSVAQMLVDAEKATRRLPVDLGEPGAVTQLAVDLCDLIREAHALGY